MVHQGMLDSCEDYFVSVADYDTFFLKREKRQRREMLLVVLLVTEAGKV